MELVTRQQMHTQKYGTETFTVEAGKKVRIRYWSPDAIDVLDVSVPAGKSWSVSIVIDIQEVDA